MWLSPCNADFLKLPFPKHSHLISSDLHSTHLKKSLLLFLNYENWGSKRLLSWLRSYSLKATNRLHFFTTWISPSREKFISPYHSLTTILSEVILLQKKSVNSFILLIIFTTCPVNHNLWDNQTSRHICI